MHDLRVVRTKIEPSDVLFIRDWDGQREIPINIALAGLEEVTGHFEHEIWVAETPSGPGGGRLKTIRPSSFRRAARRPLSNQFDLVIAQPPLSHKFAVAGDRLPGRHEMSTCRVRDRHGSRAGIFVRQEVKGRAPARPMTTRASCKKDR